MKKVEDSRSDYLKIKPSEVDRMPLDELKKLAKALHQQIDVCKNTQPLNPHGIREEKLKTIIAERETWK